jgi:hypothetical protein
MPMEFGLPQLHWNSLLVATTGRRLPSGGFANSGCRSGGLSHCISICLQFVHELTAYLPCRAPAPQRIALAGLRSPRGIFMLFRFLRTITDRPFLASIFAVAISLSLAPAVHASEIISVNVDQAKLFKLTGRVATLVVGNPLIADVTLQPGGVVVVTGKGYGATNVIAMDRTGEVLEDRIIRVEGPTDQVVTVYKGVERESYSCMPVCQRRITLGDGEGYFKSTMEQAGTLSGQASSGGGATTGRAN